MLSRGTCICNSRFFSPPPTKGLHGYEAAPTLTLGPCVCERKLHNLLARAWASPTLSLVYKNTCIDQPTDRVRPIHVILICCTCPCSLIPPDPTHATLMWTVQCVVEMATRLRMPTMEKQKAEITAQQTARLERERNQRTSSYLHFLVGVTILGFHVLQFFSLFTSHKPFSHKYNTYTPHSGQDLRTRNAYRRA